MKKETSMSNTTGISVVIACLLILIILPTSIATGSSSTVVSPKSDVRAVLAGHSFAAGGGERVYTFDLIFAASYSGEVAANEHSIKTRISWNGANHTLTVHNETGENIWGHQEIDVKYQCDKDPILDPSSKCRYISHTPYRYSQTLYPEGHKNNVIYINPLTDYDPTIRNSIPLSTYRGVITSAKLKLLIWDAMAKSMTPLKPKPVKKVPADVMLQVKVASDIPIPTKQPIDFYVIRQDRNTLLDASGKKIKMPIVARFITTSTALHNLSNLPQGLYLFHARMMTSLTTWQESKTVSFQVGKKTIPRFKAKMAITSPVENKYYTGDIPVTIKLPHLKPGCSLRLVLGFQDGTVSNGNKQSQTHPFSVPIMDEKFNLKDGQTTFTTKYRHNKLITATKNKPGQFQLQVELSIPGGKEQKSTRIFHLAQLGEPAYNDQQLKSGKINLNLPADHGLVNSRVDTPTVVTKLKPAEIKSKFKIVSPKSGEVFRNQFLVDISVPPALPGQPTITLKLICRPLQKDLLKKRNYNPDTTLMTMPLYARYKDRVWTPIMAYNIQSKVFHGENRFSASEFKIKAIIHTGKTTLTQTSGWFKILYDDRTYRQENSTVGKSAPGVLLVGTIKTFKAPAYIKISVGHVWNSEIDYQIQSNNCKFGKKYQTISLKPKITITNETTKILTFFITKAGCYRVRARHRKTGTVAVWSPWCNFTVLTTLTKVSNSPPVNSLSVSGNKVTNTPSSPTQKLEITGLRTSYKAPTRVVIKLAGVSHNPPFELRYRPATGGRYVNVKNPSHNFSHKINSISLTINIKKPGHYQLRFKNNDQKSWTLWKNFTVTSSKISGTGSTPHPIRTKAINPQPEPPGRPATLPTGTGNIKTTPFKQNLKPQLQSHVKPVNGVNGKLNQAAHPALPAKNVVVTIQTPRERHKYIMTGKSIHITTKTSNPTKTRLQIQLQKKQKNRFVDIHPRINQHHSHAQTLADFTLSQRGEYRFRVKTAAKNSKFGPWRTFLIDTIIKHSVTPKPTQVKPTAPTTSKPVTTLHPTLQHIR